jgi:murein DD-endopeptidase MepM/ murein hydrolase activator NlpD
MNTLCRNFRTLTIYGTVLMLLVLSACLTQTATPSISQLLATPAAQQAVACDACAQATLIVAMTQQQINAANQAAADAEIVRANAQATLNSANGTLSAVQTQQQSDANVVAAQIAATAEIVRANAQATLYSAGSTQSAALTADAIHQTQMVDLATTGAQAILNQQYKDNLAASTQTAIANVIATQGQAAAATSQWYVDQGRQRQEQRQGPITFLWVWCLPVFIVLLAGLVLWGFWRRLKIQQANQRILEKSVDRLPAPTVEVSPHHHGGSLPYLEGDVVDSPDQVRRWLDEVKRKLLSSEEKDDNTDK